MQCSCRTLLFFTCKIYLYFLLVNFTCKFHDLPVEISEIKRSAPARGTCSGGSRAPRRCSSGCGPVDAPPGPQRCRRSSTRPDLAPLVVLPTGTNFATRPLAQRLAVGDNPPAPTTPQDCTWATGQSVALATIVARAPQVGGPTHLGTRKTIGWR